MTSKTKLLFKGSSLRILQTTVSIVIGFLMMPFLINMLGEEMYGLWIVIASIVGSYHLLDLGFNQAVTRNVAKYIHQDDPETANKFINTAIVIYSILGFVILLISFVAATLGAESLMKNKENISLAQIILIISGVTLALEFPSKAFPGILSAYLRFDVLTTIKIIANIVDALLIFIFVSNGYGLIAIATITFLTRTINTAIYIFYTTRLFKDLKISRKHVDKKTFDKVFHFSKWVFIFDINTLIKQKMDIWFIAFFHTNTLLTVYYVAVRLTEYALQLLMQATNLSGPIFTEYYAKNNTYMLNQAVNGFLKINFFCGVVVVSGFYLVGESFIKLWMGKDFASNEAYICLVILAFGRVAAYLSSPLYSLLLTLNKHSIASWISLGETIVSAILCYLLIPKYDIQGAAIAIAIPYFFGGVILLPIFIARLTGIDYRNILPRFICFLFISAMLSFQIKDNLNNLSAVMLILSSILILLSHCVLGVILTTKQDRLWIINKIRAKFSPAAKI